MTNEAKKQLVLKFVDAVNRQDWRQFELLIAPEFVRHSSTFGQSRVNNRDKLREYLIAEFRPSPPPG